MGAGGETSITCASSSAGSCNITAYVIKGAETSGAVSTIVDASNYVSGSTGATVASPALSTVTDNCLLIHGVTWDATYALCDPGDISLLGSIYNAGGQASGCSFKGTAGAISTFTWKGSNASNSGLSWVVAIKSESANQSIRSTDGRAYLIKLGGFDTLTTSAPDSVTGLTTISSIAMNTVANTTGGTLTSAVGQPTTTPWATDGLKLSCNQTLTAAAWCGAFFAVTSVNVSGKVVQIPYGFGGTISTTHVGTEGLICVLADASNNYVAYSIAPQLDWSIQGSGTLTILPGTSTTIASSGDPTAAVTKIGLFFHRPVGGTTSIDIYMGSPFVQNSLTAIIGGDATYEIAALNAALLTLGGNLQPRVLPYPVYAGSASFQGSAQLVNKFGLQFGDGTNETHVNFSAQSFEFPYDDKQWRVGGDVGGITIYASANDVMNFSSCLLVSSSAEDFTIHASSTVNDIYNFNGLSLIGWNVTDNKGLTWEGTSFSTGGTVTIAGGGDLTNCTIAKTTSSNAALSITANGSVVTTSTIDCVMDTGADADYHISLGASVTAFEINGTTLSGTPGTDKFYSALASGTLTITTDGTGTALVAGDVTFVGGSTAVAVIAAPQVYQKVTVSGITTGARVQIYDTTSSTELFNGTATAGDTVVSGSTVVWTDPAAASANRAIRVRVSYVSGVTAKNFIETSGLTCGQTAGTAEITYPVSPTDDTVYNANGENGSTIYGAGEISFVDASPDRIEMNMTADTISLKEQYAAWVYYVFTSAGIASDIDYINAIDTANYEYTGIRWKNTSSPTAPLKITGGYAWDSSTLDPMTLIDTSGGTIFLAPAHVVAYQTTGTYAITGDLQDALDAIAGVPADVLSAAQTNPIHSDVRKVVGITVDGTGTDGDPWGPA